MVENIIVFTYVLNISSPLPGIHIYNERVLVETQSIYIVGFFCASPLDKNARIFSLAAMRMISLRRPLLLHRPETHQRLRNALNLQLKHTSLSEAVHWP